MLIQDIVPPQQVVVLREYFLSAPNVSKTAPRPAGKTSKAAKPKAHKVKVH